MRTTVGDDVDNGDEEEERAVSIVDLVEASSSFGTEIHGGWVTDESAVIGAESVTFGRLESMFFRHGRMTMEGIGIRFRNGEGLTE
ncbi:hypothetical protein Lal_00033323 [Lupinus albus]|nr:hypothetical protein Lal_00033323 [Lupinus albus]